MNRISIAAVLLAGSVVFTAGCATKKHVNSQVAPVMNKVNELDDLTAQTSRQIKDTDVRAQQGIQGVNSKAEAADQKAQTAGQQADQAQQLASNAARGVDALTEQVINLDNYRPVAETAVHFGFDKADLDRKSRRELDEIASQVPNTKGYIIQVEGGTDSVGDAAYNYNLSQRRASAVIQYLAQKHNIPAHKIYVIGLGKDKPVARNTSSRGRAENRRVDVRLMSNIAGQNASQPTTAQQ